MRGSDHGLNETEITSFLIDDAIREVRTSLKPSGKLEQLYTALEDGARTLHQIHQAEDAVFLQTAVDKRSISFQRNSNELEPAFFAIYSGAPQGVESTDHITVFVDWQNASHRNRAIELLENWMLKDTALSELRQQFPIQ